MEISKLVGVRSVEPKFMAETLDRQELRRILPHRGSAILLNCLTVDSTDESGWAEMEVTKRMCKGHFPNKPICPGVIYVEAMAQTLGAVAALKFQMESMSGFLKEASVKFVGSGSGPGDRLTILVSQVERQETRGRLLVKGKCLVKNGNMTIATASNITITIPKATS